MPLDIIPKNPFEIEKNHVKVPYNVFSYFYIIFGITLLWSLVVAIASFPHGMEGKFTRQMENLNAIAYSQNEKIDKNLQTIDVLIQQMDQKIAEFKNQEIDMAFKISGQGIIISDTTRAINDLRDDIMPAALKGRR